MTLPNRAGYRLPHLIKSTQNSTVATAAAAATPSSATVAASTTATTTATRRELLALPSLTHPQHRDVAMHASGIECEAHHELLPLIQRLKQMIARPDKLFAAVASTDVISAPGSDEFRLQLRKQAAAFQRTELRDLAPTWHRFVSTVTSPSSANAYLKRLDHMMMKLALFFMRLWNYIAAICIDAVVNMRVVVSVVHKRVQPTSPDRRRGAVAMPPSPPFAPMFEPQSVDALSQTIVRTPNAMLSKRSRLTRHSNEFMIGWFIAHKDNPYPTADERTQIAEKTGLTEQQVRNWFANMRKRHWKPSRSSTKKPRCLLDVVLRKHEV